MIINVTATIEIRIPAMILVVSASPKTNVPTRIAVIGSKTPNTEALVAPMFLVAPQQRNAKQRKSGFFIFPKNAKKCGSRPPLVEQEVEQTGVPNISTLKERFSLIHNILHSIKRVRIPTFVELMFNLKVGENETRFI